MAINPSNNTNIGTRFTPISSEYPYGSSKNESNANDNDGTPYFEGRANDVFGFQQAILRLSEVTPSGDPDNALESQYLKGLIELASGRAMLYDDTGVVNNYVLNVRTNQQEVSGLFDGMELRFKPLTTNTNTVTINAFETGDKDLRDSSFPGILVKDVEVKIRYNFLNDDYTIVDTNLAVGLLSKNWPTIANNDSNPNHAIDFSKGRIISSTGTSLITINNKIMKLFNNQWRQGSGLGGRVKDDVVGSKTTFHCFVIKNESTGVSDAGFTKDVTGAALLIESGFDSAKWVGAIITNIDENIIGFTQYGDRFIYDVPIVEYDTILTTSQVTNTEQVTVPTGIRSLILLNFTFKNEVSMDGTTVASVAVWNEDQVEVPDHFNLDTGAISIQGYDRDGGQISVISNLSSEFKWKVTETEETSTFQGIIIGCYGWEIDRGLV